MVLDQLADPIGVVSLVGQHDGVWAEAVKQRICDLAVMRLTCDLAVMRLTCGQAEPDREALRVDDDVNFGCEPAARSTETMICIPLFAVAACWWARTEVLSIICMSPSCAAVMAFISRSQTPACRHRLKRL